MGKVIFLLFLMLIATCIAVVKFDMIDYNRLLTETLGFKIKDVNEVGPSQTNSEAVEKAEPVRSTSFFSPKISFPQQRTLIDGQGRPLPATVLAKRGDSIAIQRSSDGKEFVIPLAKLGPEDQKYFSAAPDSDAEVFAGISSREKLKGRAARWTSNLPGAQREAEQLGLPIFLLFTGTSWCLPCQEMEKKVLSSKTFQQFANENLVLMKITVGQTRKMSGSDAQLASKFNISSYPTVVLLNASGESFYNQSGASTDPDEYISKLKRTIAGRR